MVLPPLFVLFYHPDVMHYAGDSQSGKLPLSLFSLGLRPDIRDGCDPDFNAAYVQDSGLMYQASRVRRGCGLGDLLCPDVRD